MDPAASAQMEASAEPAIITVGATRRALWNVLEAVKNDRKPDPDDLREIEKRITDLCIST
jgi:hypothetical protein